MVSPAFVCYSNFRAFCEREGVEYLSSRLCDVMEHLHAALRESSRHELQGSSGQLRSPLHSPLSPLPPLWPLSPLSANGFGPAFTSATMLCALGDKIARYGRSPPASSLTSETSSVWVNASSLVYRLGQLPPHVQASCRDTTDEIKE